jgi:hypothetical protein
MAAWCTDDRGLALLDPAENGYVGPPGAKAFISGPPFDVWIIALDGEPVAGPFSLAETVTGMQCATDRRFL